MDTETVFVRVPAALKERIEKAAKAENVSVNRWATTVFADHFEANKDYYEQIGKDPE